MISSQVLQNAIDELRSITRIDLCVFDPEGRTVVSTFNGDDISTDMVRLFNDSAADSQVIRESSGIYEAGQEHVVQAEVVWTVEGNLAQVLQAQVPQAETSTEMEEDAVNQQEATGG